MNITEIKKDLSLIYTSVSVVLMLLGPFWAVYILSRLFDWSDGVTIAGLLTAVVFVIIILMCCDMDSKKEAERKAKDFLPRISPRPRSVRDHITAHGFIKSDKYDWCLKGFIPLKLTDPDAQTVLIEYAALHQFRDADFADDILYAIREARRVAEKGADYPH